MTISPTSNEPFWFKRASRSLSAIVPRACAAIDQWPDTGRSAHLCRGDVKSISIWPSHELLSLDASGIPVLFSQRRPRGIDTVADRRNRNQFAESAREGYNYATIKEVAILESMIIGLILMTLRFSQAVRILIWTIQREMEIATVVNNF